MSFLGMIIRNGFDATVVFIIYIFMTISLLPLQFIILANFLISYVSIDMADYFSMNYNFLELGEWEFIWLQNWWGHLATVPLVTLPLDNPYYYLIWNAVDSKNCIQKSNLWSQCLLISSVIVSPLALIYKLKHWKSSKPKKSIQQSSNIEKSLEQNNTQEKTHTNDDSKLCLEILRQADHAEDKQEPISARVVSDTIPLSPCQKQIGDNASSDLKGNNQFKVLVIGKSGEGKSTLCNVIAGKEHSDNLFSVSDQATSCTQHTKLATIYFRGKVKTAI